MIEPSNIEQILRSRFNDLTVVNPGLFKASESYNGHPFRIYFFDCRTDVLTPDFDLDNYQDRILSDEYYQQSGSMQWNMYLYFICEPQAYSRLYRSGQLAAIESNKVFSRKYVTTETQLQIELSRPSDLSKSAQDYALEIGSRWTEKLRSSQLDGIFLDVPRSKVVERYMCGKPIIEAEKFLTAKETHRSFLSPIKHLKLVKFRRYPEQNNFDFGRCNLLYGPNGSGKTSLLESIESWVCGRTLRNNKDNEDSRIGILFEDGNTIEWNSPATNALYRARDLLWYRNSYPKGNQLYISFNRFNFYNTDAGMSIADADEQDNIRTKLAALVLGETANKIEVRLKETLQLFTQQEASLQRDLSFLKKEIDDARKDLDLLLPPTENAEHILEQFCSHLRTLGWQGSIPGDGVTSTDTFVQELSTNAAAIREGASELHWLVDQSFSSLKEENETLASIVRTIESTNSEINELEGFRRSLLQIIDKLESELKFLDEERPYIENRDADKLSGLEERIRQSQGRLTNYRAATDKLASIDLYAFVSSNQSISDYEQSLNEQRAALADEINRLNSIATEISEQRNRISNIKAEIRSAVMEILEAVPTTKQCPVCGTEYPEGKLANLLTLTEQETDPTGESKSLREILQEISNRESDMQTVMKSLQELRNLKTATILLNRVGPAALKDLALQLLDIDRLITECTQELDSLNAIRSKLANEGLTEERYTQIKQQLVGTDAEQAFLSRDVNAFGNLVAQKTGSLEELRDNERKATDRIANLLQYKETALRSYFKKLLPNDFEAELRKRSAALQQQTSKLGKIVALSAGEHDSLRTLISRIGAIEAAYEWYLKSTRQIEESSTLRQRNESKIKDATEKVERTRERKKRADLAIKTIEEILINDSKEKSLEDFLLINTEEIAQSFKLIHSPREFSKIEFDGKEKGIVLSREFSGEKAQITKISSGQRTALALAIFLTMNRKLQNGPPFLLFDDPVAHVDDLNILSFLDYLRDVLINMDRQVFFATANDKVAYLFQKKFDFLKSDFRVFDLTRGAAQKLKPTITNGR
jgi:DNA repair protein SbcC/Rad50